MEGASVYNPAMLLELLIYAYSKERMESKFLCMVNDDGGTMFSLSVFGEVQNINLSTFRSSRMAKH